MMQPNSAGVGAGGSHDLEFTTTVDGSVQQNVPMPPPPQVNSVLSDMISKSAGAPNNPTSINPSTVTAPVSSAPSYKPSSPLPSILRFNRSDHPTACLFHVLFKALAFLFYNLGPKFAGDVMVTVVCILLLAADFWVVKNVTGRLLVGLRWWNFVDPATGSTRWIYESASPNADGSARATNGFDSRFFWGVLYATPLLWGLSFVTAMLWLRFQCFVTLACALALSGSNVHGYWNCSADQREKWSALMSRGSQWGLAAAMRGGVLGRLGGMMGGVGGAQRVPQEEPNTMPGTFA